MKKLYILILAVMVSAGAMAQTTYDLQLDLVTPTSGSTQDQSSPISVDFTLTNNGPDALLMGDTVWFIYADATFMNIFSLDNTAGQASGFILAADVASGSSITASTDFGGTFSFDVSTWADGETVNIICLGAGSDALSQAGDAEELDALNNVDSFILGGGTADVNEVVEASIVAFPVPTENVLNIQSSEEVANVTVIGMSGQILAESSTSTVDVSALEAGVYVYSVTTVSGYVHQEMFVKK